MDLQITPLFVHICFFKADNLLCVCIFLTYFYITVTIPSLNFVLQHGVWQWDEEDCLDPIRQFNCPLLIEQCEKYMAKNKSKSVSVPFKFRTDGTINLRMCSRFPFVLHKAAQIAHKYESRNPNTTYAATLILVVIWEVFSDMRFVYWVLWSSSFTKKPNEIRPQLIQQMLDRGFRAVYISKHLCSILVCTMI